MIRKTIRFSLLAISCLNLAFASAPFEEKVYPTVVLGGGVGGLTSSVYLGRAGIPHLVIEGQTPGGAITQSAGVQNWPGEIFITGFDLIEKMRKQAAANGAEFLSENIVSIDFSTDPYTITTQDSSEKIHTFKAKSCIIALGSTPNLLGVPGEKEYWSKGVYTCAVCDGSLYKNKTVAVIGSGDAAIEEAHYLANIAKKVFLILRSDKFKGIEEKRKQEVLQNKNIEILYNTTVEEVRGDGEGVTQLLIKSKNQTVPTLLNADALFLAIGAKPNSQLFQGKLDTDKAGYIVLKNDQQTSLPGVFAVGDITDPVYKQAITASGEGAKAALQTEKYLGSNRVALTTNPFPSVAPKSAPLLAGMTGHKLTAQTQIAPQIAQAIPIEINSVEQFNRELQDTSSPVFVDFYAPWCGPCKQLNPKVVALAKELGHKVRILKVNVDGQGILASRYGIRAMPTALLIDKNGNIVNREIGVPGIVRLIEQLRSEFEEKK